jgi:phospholipid transport system transporter-binding protein
MQETATLKKVDETHYQVHGALNVDSVVTLYQQALSIIDVATTQLHFDFSPITHSSSAGLALLTALLRYAKRQQKKVAYLHLPPKLLSAAKVSDLDQLFA